MHSAFGCITIAVRSEIFGDVTCSMFVRYLLDEEEEDWAFNNDSTLTVGRNF